MSVTRPATDPADSAGMGGGDLRLRELNHRWLNDIQQIVALLSIAARNSSAEAGSQLRVAMSRIGVIVENRRQFADGRETDLELVLARLRDTLDLLADGAGEIVLKIEGALPRLPVDMVDAIALGVNELVINAIKHVLTPRGGTVIIAAQREGSQGVSVYVEDSGLAWTGSARGTGQGLDLVTRLAAAGGGRLIRPQEGSKRFTLMFAAQATMPDADGGRRTGAL